MQLTRIDRWLREKFVHETHVYSLRPPEVLPSGVRAEDLPEKPGRKFRHRYVVRDRRAADALIAEFKAHNQMFATRIVERQGLLARLAAPEGKSVTWWLLWLVLSAFGALLLYRAASSLWHNQEFRENIRGAIEILQG